MSRMSGGFEQLETSYGTSIATFCYNVSLAYERWGDFSGTGLVGSVGFYRWLRGISRSCPLLLTDPPFSKWDKMGAFSVLNVFTFLLYYEDRMYRDFEVLGGYGGFDYTTIVELASEQLVHVTHLFAYSDGSWTVPVFTTSGGLLTIALRSDSYTDAIASGKRFPAWLAAGTLLYTDELVGALDQSSTFQITDPTSGQFSCSICSSPCIVSV
jgi:hypothetical protein